MEIVPFCFLLTPGILSIDPVSMIYKTHIVIIATGNASLNKEMKIYLTKSNVFGAI